MSETFVLRTYPFREADLIVSFFTRDRGKLRGVARRARRPKNSPFGSGLERLSHVRMVYYLRENAELGLVTGCELIQSQFGMQADYARSVALDYFTEVSEHLLPPHEPNEKFFRLLIAVLADLREGGNERTAEGVVRGQSKSIAEGVVRDQNKSTAEGVARDEGKVWRAVAYFSVWAVRLAGVLPELRVSHETAEIVHEMFEKPLSQLAPREWKKSTASDLRRALVRTMEQHVERRFLTVPLLEAL